MNHRCASYRADGQPCAREGRWLAGYSTASDCFQHAVRRAIDERAVSIFDPRTARCLLVSDLPERRAPERMPKTVEEFTAALNACDGSDGRRVSNLFVAAMEQLTNLSLGSRTSPLRQAIDAAKGRVARYEREHQPA